MTHDCLFPVFSPTERGMKDHIWHVYLLICADASLYCGISCDVARRLRQHNGELAGGARYTRTDGRASGSLRCLQRSWKRAAPGASHKKAPEREKARCSAASGERGRREMKLFPGELRRARLTRCAPWHINKNSLRRAVRRGRNVPDPSGSFFDTNALEA